LLLVSGDHNSIRPDFFYDSVAIFFHNVLHDQESNNVSSGDFVETSKLQSHEQMVSAIDMWEPSTLDPVGHSFHFETSTFGDLVPSSADDELEQIQKALAASLGCLGQPEETCTNSLPQQEVSPQSTVWTQSNQSSVTSTSDVLENQSDECKDQIAML